MDVFPIKKRHSDKAGFSLVELLITVSLGMVLAATSIPMVVTTLAEFRLRSSLTSAAALVRSTRALAIENDVSYRLYSQRVGTSSVVWADADRDGAYDAGEPAVYLPAGVIVSADAAAEVALMGLDYTPQPPDGSLAFNARGVPCVVIGAACSTMSAEGEVVGYVLVLQQERSQQETAMMAIAVSPTGTIQTWSWAGSEWKVR
jgi:Tfp pilus assembly protein PilE